ncbi:hypothetical protein Bca4012_004797 [Brassica carinata]
MRLKEKFNFYSLRTVGIKIRTVDFRNRRNLSNNVLDDDVKDDVTAFIFSFLTMGLLMLLLLPKLQNATNDSLERVFKELHPHFLSLASNTNTYAVHVLKKMLDGAAVSLYIQPPWTCGPSTPSHGRICCGACIPSGQCSTKTRTPWRTVLNRASVIQTLELNFREKVDISNTKKLLEGEDGRQVREKDMIVVGESGLFIPDDIAYVQAAGVKAVLVGESIVKQNDPEKGIARLFGRNISQA